MVELAENRPSKLCRATVGEAPVLQRVPHIAAQCSEFTLQEIMLRRLAGNVFAKPRKLISYSYFLYLRRLFSRIPGILKI